MTKMLSVEFPPNAVDGDVQVLSTFQQNDFDAANRS